MDFVQKQIERFRTSAAEEKLCYILLFSIFLPFMLTAIVVLTVLCLLLSKKEARDRIFQADGIKWFGVLCIPLFLSPILQMHWLGLAAGVGLAVVVLVGIWVSSVMKRELFENCLELAVFLSFPVAIVGYIQKAVSFVIPLGVDKLYRISSVFFNPNYYGAMIEMLVLVCLYKLLNKPGRKKSIYYFAALLVNLAALYLADSFSAWAAIAASMFVLLLLHKQYKILLCLTFAGILALIAVFTIPQILPRLSFVDHTIMKRVYIWQRAFDGFLENPLLGRGTLGYWMLSQDELRPTYVLPHAHNILLDPLLNYGLIGAAGLFGFFIKRFGPGLVQLLRSKNKAIGLFGIALITAVLVHGVNDVTLLWHQTGLFAMFLLAGLRIEENEKEAAVELPLRLSVRIKKGLEGLEGAVSIRREVFMKEQGFVGEFDDIDAVAYHVVVYDRGKPVATGRTYFDEEAGVYKIGRVAVKAEYRRHHVGSVVIRELEQKIRTLGGDSAMLSAQIQAQGFYEKLGYRIRGAKYYDEHCPHVNMVKSL